MVWSCLIWSISGTFHQTSKATQGIEGHHESSRNRGTFRRCRKGMGIYICSVRWGWTIGYYWLVGLVKLIIHGFDLEHFVKQLGNRLCGHAELKEHSIWSTMTCIREACKMKGGWIWQSHPPIASATFSFNFSILTNMLTPLLVPVFPCFSNICKPLPWKNTVWGSPHLPRWSSPGWGAARSFRTRLRWSVFRRLALAKRSPFRGSRSEFNGHSRILKWRYLPYIRPI